MKIVELAQKTGSTVLKSQLTKTIVATAVGFVASKVTGNAYEKYVIGSSDVVA